MRTTALMIIVLLACAPVFADGSGDADPQTWDDSTFTLGFGTGPGWGKLSDNVFRIYDDYAHIPRLHEREGGPVLQLSGGYRLLEDLTVGLELQAWSRHADDDLAAARLDMMLAAAAVTWYPRRGDLFLRLGYGLGGARIEYLDRGIGRSKLDTGTGYLLGLGYDLRLTGSMTLSPQITNTGFATRDLEVWATLTALTLRLTTTL